MYLKIRPLKLRHLLLIAGALTIGITAVTASARLWRRGDVTPGPVMKTPVSQSPNQSPSAPTLTLLPIQLRQTGFTRAELTVPAGDLELLILNASGEQNLTLKLEREGEHGKDSQTLTIKRGQPLRKKLHLRPGVYVLSVLDHDDWVCRLNITEQ